MFKIDNLGISHRFHYRPSSKTYDYWVVNNGDSRYVGTLTFGALTAYAFVIKNNNNKNFYLGGNHNGN